MKSLAKPLAIVAACVLLRLYGPLEPFFDKSWRPIEIELVP